MKALMRHRPFGFTTLRRELDDLFEDFLPKGWDLEKDLWTPLADVVEDDDRYLVTMDLPGLKKEEVEIDFQDGFLNVKGERLFEEKEEKDNFRRLERRYGKFFRSFMLPVNVKEEMIEAKFKDGVLEIVVPKAEESKPKKIAIN
jgi:HSP20 family protein